MIRVMKKSALVLGAISLLGLLGWAVSRRVELGAQPGGGWLVSTGQMVTPWGRQAVMPGVRPKAAAWSPDGRSLAVLTTGGVQFLDRGGKVLSRVNFGGGPTGLAWSPNGQTVYASQSDGLIAAITVESGERRVLKVEDEGRTGNAQTTGLAVSPDGKTLYAALGIRNEVVAMDAATGGQIWRTAVAAAPYHLALSMGGEHLAVACRGGEMVRAGSALVADSAGTMVSVNPETDAVLAGALSVLDARSGESGPVTRTPPHPSALAWTKDGASLYAAFADADLVGRYELTGKGLREAKMFGVRPPEDSHFGQIPTSLAFSADESILYVGLGGANAVAGFDPLTGAAKGWLPTAYYPVAIAFSQGELAVAAAKGIGSREPTTAPGPYEQRGLKPRDDAFYIHNNVGMVHLLSARDLSRWRQGSDQVAKNNRWGSELPARKDVAARPLPERVGEPSPIKHVVFIIKENLTYDSILGDMREGKGDPSLCMFPEIVSPNHHDLAREFVLLDNTYVSGTNSADGHQWTVSAVANDYMERNYGAYARSYPYDGGDPLAFSPEGFLWTSALKQGKTVRVYGEMVDQPSVRNRESGRNGTFKEIWDSYTAGRDDWQIEAKTSQAALRPYLHPRFIGFPSNVSDQWRADQFLADLAEFEQKGEMPNLIIMLLPNDHTVGFREDYPTPQAAVADNDLAMGRIVEGLSKSPFWKDMLVLGIQDDAQLGLDHVDGHRTYAMAAGPYVRRGAVVSDHYNTLSFLRTMGLVLGMPAMTRFDRSAVPMREIFTDKPNLAPYKARKPIIPLNTYPPKREDAQGSLAQLMDESIDLDLSEVDRADTSVVARAAWHDAFGDKPFPWSQFRPKPMVD